MAIVKANYVKRGREAKDKAKAHVRYITHRPGAEQGRVSRELFTFDGSVTKAQAYRMIDEAPHRGSLYYRIVLSPDPKREDRFKDLALREITIDTMLALEERLGRRVQFVAALHSDHTVNRHVHALVILHGQKLTRGDFLALRRVATAQASAQRRVRDQALRLAPSRYHTPRVLYRMRRVHMSRRGPRPYQGYTCALCGYHHFLPAIAGGYRCPADGLRMRRDRGAGRALSRAKGVGRGLAL
jgi:hypothetical protein